MHSQRKPRPRRANLDANYSNRLFPLHTIRSKLPILTNLSLIHITLLIARNLLILLLHTLHQIRQRNIIRFRNNRRLISKTSRGQTSILTANSPPKFSMTSLILSTPDLTVAKPISLSITSATMMYSGGATNLTWIGHPSVLIFSPSWRAALIASMPSYEKHVTSMSARILAGCGVRRREIWVNRAGRTLGFGGVKPENTLSDCLG